jgi:hypothetical protein
MTGHLFGVTVAGARPLVAPAPAGFIVLSHSQQALTRRMHLLP